MAVVATLSKGYDLDYIWKQVDRGPAKDAASYYIQASESGGEPPGRWWGPGARALGFEPGQRVEREPYDLLFGERKAPDGTQLGRPPGDGRKAADLYAQLLAAEPHATAERKRELRTEAVRKARQSPLFFDLTLSLSKSISIFHASLGENARLARQAGDHDGDQYWSALVGEVDEMIWQAVHAGFGYFQREAGYTRTGSHGTRVHGRETGQWHEADLAVAHWLQHTSRDGDMQLHVHSQIAHVAKTSDRRQVAGPGLAGLQRAHRRGRRDRLPAPGRGPHRPVRPGMDRAGRRPRVRDHGHQRGDDARVLLAPRVDHGGSARPRGAVRAAVRPRAVPARARAPRAGVELHDAQPQARRAGSRAGARGLGGQARADPRRLAGVGRAVGLAWRSGPRRRARARRGSPAPVPAELELARAAQKAVALAQQEKSAWTRADLIKYLGRVLPRTGRDPAAAAALLEDLADRALASEFEPVTCLEAPEPAEVPASLLRADGRSVYQRHGGTRYATRAQLAMEERMVAQAGADGAPRVTRAQAARALGADPARLEDALTGHAHAREAQDARDAQDTRTGSGLREDQAAAALAVADRWPARVGDQRAGRVREDPGAGRGRPDLGRGRARPGDRHHRVPVGPQHPGRRSPGVVQRRAVPGPPARPARRPRPGPDRPGHLAGDR